jgi:hypothetical protein
MGNRAIDRQNAFAKGPIDGSGARLLAEPQSEMAYSIVERLRATKWLYCEGGLTAAMKVSKKLFVGCTFFPYSRRDGRFRSIFVSRPPTKIA